MRGPYPLAFDAYQAIQALNWSTLKAMRISPLHFRYAREHAAEETPAMRRGRATHCAILEPDRFAVDFTVYRGRRQGKAWDAFAEAADGNGQTVLTAAEWDLCRGMRDAVRAHPAVAPLLTTGAAEQVIEWTEAGRACKGRIDWLTQRDRRALIVDLKTGARIAGPPWEAVVARLGYHCQLAWYAAGYEAATGERPDLVLVSVESSPPFDVVVYEVDDVVRETGAGEVRDLLARVAECEAKGAWPGRALTPRPLELPQWAYLSEGELLDDPEGAPIDDGEDFAVA